MEFNSDYDKETFISMDRLKKNKGFFKSPKQRDYFKKQKLEHVNFNNFSIETNQFVILVGGQVRFADYGIRSVRRVEWIFVMDDFGIKKQLKIRFEYSADGRYASPSGVYEIVWERDDAFDPPVFVQEEVVEKQFIGEVGKRMQLEGIVKSARQVGHGFYGPTYQTIIETDNGGVLVYWNLVKLADGKYAGQGSRIKFSAGIKAFEIFKDVPQTHITRVTKASE